jgi:hypothetical protein
MQTPENCFEITGVVKSIVNPNLTIVLSKHSSGSKILYVNSSFVKVKFSQSKLKDMLAVQRISGNELYSPIGNTGPKDLIINSDTQVQRMIVRKTILSLSLLQNYRC